MDFVSSISAYHKAITVRFGASERERVQNSNHGRSSGLLDELRFLVEGSQEPAKRLLEARGAEDIKISI